MSYMVNIETIPQGGYIKIIELDGTLTGTENYMGFAYFWAYEYSHYLRQQRPEVLRKIHSEFLKQRLKVSGESEQHFKIIQKITKLQ